jgi:hypothetical protein
VKIADIKRMCYHLVRKVAIMKILDLILFPLALIGGINVFRGFCAVLEKDEEKYTFKKDWKFSIYLLIHLGGYLALFYVITRLF